MTFETTLRDKGQVTLPKKFREPLGLIPGTKLSFTQLIDGTVVVRIKHRKLSDLSGMLTREGQPVVSVEKMRR
jgi:AbrB family looped-hinge helix DNA binding protein